MADCDDEITAAALRRSRRSHTRDVEIGRPEDADDVTRRGVYPGSFNPPTVAHIAIAEAAVEQRGLDELVFTISEVALTKEDVASPSPPDRAAELATAVAHLAWAEVRVVEARLIADIAQGFDVVVIGADKWRQVNDPVFYGGSTDARDAALTRLPELAIAPRSDVTVPIEWALDLPSWIAAVSSSAVRAGQTQWRAGPVQPS